MSSVHFYHCDQSLKYYFVSSLSFSQNSMSSRVSNSITTRQKTDGNSNENRQTPHVFHIKKQITYAMLYVFSKF